MQKKSNGRKNKFFSPSFHTSLYIAFIKTYKFDERAKVGEGEESEKH